jgi:hypothetical protein
MIKPVAVVLNDSIDARIPIKELCKALAIVIIATPNKRLQIGNKVCLNMNHHSKDSRKFLTTRLSKVELATSIGQSKATLK